MSSVSGATFFGHPKGLSTLFFTEFWERFSYYGMRALLILFMKATIDEGGMAMTSESAAAIYGLYTASVYLLALPGGFVADQILGLRKAVWYGGILITLGHFSMAIPQQETFFLGLVLIVLGTGLLKPNISAMVGDLYPDGGARRDAGFSIFYMGINIGAFIAPIVCGYLGEGISWHYGFGAAGLGMAFGLVQYKISGKHLGDIGLVSSHSGSEASLKRKVTGFWIAIAAIIIVAILGVFDVYKFEPLVIASLGTAIIVTVATLYFIYALFIVDISKEERKQVGSIIVFFVFSVIFWSGFEQHGSSFNIIAKEYVDRVFFGYEIPASVLQSINPLFIITLAPIFGAMWINLAKKNLEPSTPLKFGLGLIMLGLGFLVMVFVAYIAAGGGQASAFLLILTYLLHTAGELAVSPVGLSTITKLAPKKLVGQMMGVWFMSVSLGNLVAGLVAGRFDSENVSQMPDIFWTFVSVDVIGGLLLIAFIKPVRKLMGKVY